MVVGEKFVAVAVAVAEVLWVVPSSLEVGCVSVGLETEPVSAESYEPHELLMSVQYCSHSLRAVAPRKAGRPLKRLS